LLGDLSWVSRACAIIPDLPNEVIARIVTFTGVCFVFHCRTRRAPHGKLPA
jgi:hypothetical protein